MIEEILENFFFFQNGRNLKDNRNSLQIITADSIRTCFANLLRDSLDAKSVNHCSKCFAVRRPYDERRKSSCLLEWKISTNHRRPKMGFIDRWWLSFGTIIDRMIFFFFT